MRRLRITVLGILISLVILSFKPTLRVSATTYTTLQGVSWTVGSSWDYTYSDEEVKADILAYKENIDYIWSFLRSNGFSEVATSAILGNFRHESHWLHYASEGGTEDRYDGRGLAQWTTAGTGGAGTGVHRELSDFAVNSKHKHEAGTPRKSDGTGNTWLDCAECQLGFFISNPRYGNKSMCYASGWGGVAPGITNLVTFGSFDFIAYKGGDKKLAIREATESFCLRWEIPAKGSCCMLQRVQTATLIYEMYSGSKIDIDGGTLTDAEGNVFDIKGDLLAKYNEEYFLGSTASLTEMGISLPNASYLNISEQQEIAEWKNSIDLLREDNQFRLLRVCVMFCGIVIVIYSTLLFLAFQFDRINNFIDIELVRYLSFGRLITSYDETSTYNDANEHGKAKAIVLKDAVVLMVTGIFAGVILLSGKLYAIIGLVISFSRSIL